MNDLFEVIAPLARAMDRLSEITLASKDGAHYVFASSLEGISRSLDRLTQLHAARIISDNEKLSEQYAALYRSTHSAPVVAAETNETEKDEQTPAELENAQETQAEAEAVEPETNDEAETPKRRRSRRKKSETTETAPETTEIEPETNETEKDEQTPAEPENAQETQTETENEPAPAAAENETAEPAPEITADEMRAHAVRAARRGMTNIVTEYLAARGLQKLSELDPSNFAELRQILLDAGIN